MQSLLAERRCGRLSGAEFALTLTESLYSSLAQAPPAFPRNCHAAAAVNSLALDPSESRYLLSGCADLSLKLWDTRPEEPYNGIYPALATIPRKAAHDFGISAVKWWPADSGLFLLGLFDHTVKVWDTNMMAPVHLFDMLLRVYALSVGAAAENQYNAQALVAVASDQPFVRLLDLRLALNAHLLQGHKARTLALLWHPQNPYVLALGGFDGEAKLWDIRRAAACLARLDMEKTNERDPAADKSNLSASLVKAHSAPVNAVHWDDLGHTLYTAGNDDKVRVWDCTSSRPPPINKLVNFGPLTRNKFPQLLPLVLTPRAECETQHLVFPSDLGDVLVYRALDGKLVARLLRPAAVQATRTAAIAHGGPHLATLYCGTMDGEILAWRGQAEREPWVDVGAAPVDYAAMEANLVAKPVDTSALYDDPYFRRQSP